jgi:hypothetical protein
VAPQDGLPPGPASDVGDGRPASRAQWRQNPWSCCIQGSARPACPLRHLPADPPSRICPSPHRIPTWGSRNILTACSRPRPGWCSASGDRLPARRARAACPRASPRPRLHLLARGAGRGQGRGRGSVGTEGPQGPGRNGVGPGGGGGSGSGQDANKQGTGVAQRRAPRGRGARSGAEFWGRRAGGSRSAQDGAVGPMTSGSPGPPVPPHHVSSRWPFLPNRTSS